VAVVGARSAGGGRNCGGNGGGGDGCDGVETVVETVVAATGVVVKIGFKI
jgi:hypothetical protein